MAGGGASSSFPPGVFIDPCRWGQRELGTALVARSVEQDVIEPCRMGLGGARAWSLACGDRQPHLWRFLAYDHTVRWRATPLNEEEVAVEAFWVSAVPNARLGDQLRRNIFAANRRREYRWREEDAAAWAAAERVERGEEPEAFTWAESACLGGRSEGDGGLPVGMTSRAHRVGWRVLASTREFAFVNVIWVLMSYGEEADALRRGARVRQMLEEARDSEVVWVRQASDRHYYGHPFCPHCVASGRCIRCMFVDSRQIPHNVFFQEPTMLTSSPSDWEDDIALYRELGVLS